jgi:hypothetical protein
MGDVAPPLAELTARAQTLTTAGDLVAARAVLTDALDPVDADPQRASPDLADAASLLARILIALGDPHGARLWAGFAHAAGDRLYGPHDERTVAAAALHAAVLQRIGNHGRAAQLYQSLVSELTALDGPDSPRVLAAEADLATAEHAAGQCAAARPRLANAWARHRQVYGDATPAGIKMLARLGAMERECGRTTESAEHLARAQELCARYLPADHPLAKQAATLASAPASGRHICGRVQRSTGPEPAPGVRSVHVPGGPGVEPVRSGPYRDGPRQGDPQREEPDRESPWGTQQYRPEPASSAQPPPSPPQARAPRANPPGAPPQTARPETATPQHSAPPHSVPPQDVPPQGVPGQRRPAQSVPAQSVPAQSVPTPSEPRRNGPAHSAFTPVETQQNGEHGGEPAQNGPARNGPAHDGPARSGPAVDLRSPSETLPDAEQPEPDDRVTDPKGKVYQQPLYLSDVHQAPGDLTGRHARADTLPPLPGQRAPEVGPDGRQIRIGAVEVPPPIKMAPPDRRLPVPLDQPEPRGSWQPLVLVAVLVAGIAVAAAVVVATLPRADGGTASPAASGPVATAPAASAPAASPPSPTASQSPAGSDAGPPPGDVRLRDNHDSVSLDWAYPKGAEGPVLISGGRTGQEQRAFQQLPAGTANYVVYGLNEQLDYCFTVAVVYTVDHVAASKPLCTTRK